MANSSFPIARGSSSFSVKAVAGTFFGYDLTNLEANVLSVLFFKATVPVFGVDNPLARVILLPFQGKVRASTTGITFATGLQILVVTEQGGIPQPNVAGHIEFA
jgi:hypothetical protein